MLYIYEKCCALTTWKFIDFHVNQSLAINGNEQFVWAARTGEDQCHRIAYNRRLRLRSLLITGGLRLEWGSAALVNTQLLMHSTRLQNCCLNQKGKTKEISNELPCNKALWGYCLVILTTNSATEFLDWNEESSLKGTLISATITGRADVAIGCTLYWFVATLPGCQEIKLKWYFCYESFSKSESIISS